MAGRFCRHEFRHAENTDHLGIGAGHFYRCSSFAMPGDSNDPLVTKSWVDNYINEKFNQVSADITATKNMLANVKNGDFLHAKLQVSSKNAQINGVNTTLDVAPFIESNRTLVPIRVISDALGASLAWDGNKKQVTYTTANCEVKLIIGNKTALINGQQANMDVAAKLVNNRTMIPLRFVGEAMGARVDWMAETKTIEIY